MLDKASDELIGCKGQGVPLSVFAILVFESDQAILVLKEPLRTQGRAINVSGQILNSSLSTAHRLHIHYPFLFPDRCRYLLGIGLALKRLLHPIAKTRGQNDLRQEEVCRFGLAPAQSVGTQSAGWHHAMYMRMELELSAPGVQHAQAAYLSTQVFVAPGHLLQGAGAFLEQGGITDLLMRAQPPAQAFGHGEGDQIIRHRQKLELLTLNPLAGLGVATLRTGPMIAGMIDKMVLV